MAIKSRIEKIEQTEKPKKTAFFSINDGKASGAAWWRDDLRWENLSRPEYDHLTAELKAEGIEILSVNIIGVYKKGAGIDGWGQAVEV